MVTSYKKASEEGWCCWVWGFLLHPLQSSAEIEIQRNKYCPCLIVMTIY